MDDYRTYEKDTLLFKVKFLKMDIIECIHFSDEHPLYNKSRKVCFEIPYYDAFTEKSRALYP